MAHTTLPARNTQTVAAVTRYAGDGAYGPVYDPAVDVNVAVSEGRRLVRNSQGDQVVSETTLYANPDDNDKLAPESQVTVNGRTSRLISSKLHSDLRGRPAMVEAMLE